MCVGEILSSEGLNELQLTQYVGMCERLLLVV